MRKFILMGENNIFEVVRLVGIELGFSFLFIVVDFLVREFFYIEFVVVCV